MKIELEILISRLLNPESLHQSPELNSALHSIANGSDYVRVIEQLCDIISKQRQDINRLMLFQPPAPIIVDKTIFEKLPYDSNKKQ